MVTLESAGVIEYSGIQRIGKTTLMVAELCNKLINPYMDWCYRPEDVYVNFEIRIEGLHCVNNEDMVNVLKKAKDERWRNKVFVVDECSQPPLFYARNTKNRLQTELVTSLWQMPKLGCTFLYSCNIGNSVDIQQRDATWFTIIPMRYVKGKIREEDYIEYRVVAGYEIWTIDEVYWYPSITQELFDTNAPVI